MVRAKMFMQQAWLDALAWDEVLPSEQKEEWRSWFTELPLLEEIKIPWRLKDRYKGSLDRPAYIF